jgi:hydrogenase-4 component B
MVDEPLPNPSMSLFLILAAIAASSVSGLPSLFLGRASNRGQFVAAILSVAGSGLGLAGVALHLVNDDAPAISWPWSIPGGSFSVALDGLSALFLVLVFLISGAGAVYGLGYWLQSEKMENGRKLRAFYGLLAAGMALLLVARSSVLFLVGWELMALSAF